jgi:S1-C subfamily serine protease
MDNVLAALSNDLAAAVERVAQSIVSIEARRRFPSSGIYWGDGLVVTAAHTIKREEEIHVTLPDGASARAGLAGLDRGTDIACLKIAPADAARVPAFAPVDTLRPGHLVLAVGRSAGSGIGAALGAISSIGGAWRTWRGGQIERLVRLDISLYPGFSGAAVVGPDGAVAGIATSGLSRFVPLAIPSETIDRIAGEILTHGYVPHGYLGLGLQPITIPSGTRGAASGTAGPESEAARAEDGRSERERGLIVMSVEADAAAEAAGVLIGDVLIALGGQSVETIDDVHSALDAAGPGRPLRALLLRGGKTMETEITIGERPRRAR